MPIGRNMKKLILVTFIVSLQGCSYSQYEGFVDDHDILKANDSQGSTSMKASDELRDKYIKKMGDR